MRLAAVGGPLPITVKPEGKLVFGGDLAFEGAEAFGGVVRVGVSTFGGLGALGFDGGGVCAGSLLTIIGVLDAVAFGASTGFGVFTTGLGGGGMLL